MCFPVSFEKFLSSKSFLKLSKKKKKKKKLQGVILMKESNRITTDRTYHIQF